MSTNRREFLRLSGAGLTALMLPGALSRMARAAGEAPPVLVVIYQRGGCDGLSLVIPRGDVSIATTGDPISWYETLRPTTMITGGLPVSQDYQNTSNEGRIGNGFFEMHPAFADVKALYDDDPYAAGTSRLAVVHATGRTRSYSHFTAQDRMENADPNDEHPRGWLHRAVWHLTEPAPEDPAFGAPSTLMGVALDSTGIQALRGPLAGRTLSLGKIDGFQLSDPFKAERQSTLRTLYEALPDGPGRRSAQDLQRASGTGLFSALADLQGLPDAPSLYDDVGDYHFRRRLQDAARLVKDESLGVRIVCVDQHGWDHHESLVGKMNDRATNLNNGLRALYQDLGSTHAARTLVLVMTEFGRTAWENGGYSQAGTDHGWGSVMLALGGSIRGKRVLCRELESDGDLIGWPGLAPGRLHESGDKAVPSKCQPDLIPSEGPSVYEPGERDLEVTIDFRDVFAEVLEKHLQIPRDLIYPEDPADPDAAVDYVIPVDATYTRSDLPDGGLFTPGTG